ncbi:hypothetical protein GQ54DRAFT_253938 [Martensiomyces pterosporus]|nr:hypothetical protein GQ54DRAFT_253938 [Martensiomyces pterosporus]
MEAEIDNVLKSVYAQDPSVTGIVVVDESGLCLATEGDISDEAAGLVASIAARSDIVLPPAANQTAASTPVVQIEAESLVITIRRTLGVTMGIFKHRQG